MMLDVVGVKMFEKFSVGVGGTVVLIHLKKICQIIWVVHPPSNSGNEGL